MDENNVLAGISSSSIFFFAELLGSHCAEYCLIYIILNKRVSFIALYGFVYYICFYWLLDSRMCFEKNFLKGTAFGFGCRSKNCQCSCVEWVFRYKLQSPQTFEDSQRRASQKSRLNCHLKKGLVILFQISKHFP